MKTNPNRVLHLLRVKTVRSNLLRQLRERDQSTEGESPTPTPTSSPAKKFAGDVKNAGEEKNDQKSQQTAEVEPVKEGEMTPEQAERLLQSMKDEEQRVQLDERKAVRPVYNDW